MLRFFPKNVQVEIFKKFIGKIYFSKIFWKNIFFEKIFFSKKLSKNIFFEKIFFSKFFEKRGRGRGHPTQLGVGGQWRSHQHLIISSFVKISKFPKIFYVEILFKTTKCQVCFEKCSEKRLSYSSPNHVTKPFAHTETHTETHKHTQTYP